MARKTSSHPAITAELLHVLTKAGVTSFRLEFSGGNDEGNLEVYLEPIHPATDDLRKQVEDWAWSVFSYSGAGDGSDYGDNYTYDLVDKKVTHQEWVMSRTDQEPSDDVMDIEGKYVEPEPEQLAPETIEEFIFRTIAVNTPLWRELPSKWWKRVRGVPTFAELSPHHRTLLSKLMDLTEDQKKAISAVATLKPGEWQLIRSLLADG